MFVCRKVIFQARASLDWTRTQSGWIKNSKQYEEIKFQREWSIDTFGQFFFFFLWTNLLRDALSVQRIQPRLCMHDIFRREVSLPLRWSIKIESLVLPFVSWQTRKKSGLAANKLSCTVIMSDLSKLLLVKSSNLPDICLMTDCYLQACVGTTGDSPDSRGSR